MIRRLTTAIAVLVFAAALGTWVGAAESPEDSIRQARQEREQIRREKADLAGQIDVLEADEAELVAALEALTADIEAQHQAIAAAEQNVREAEAVSAGLRDQLAETEIRAAAIRREAADLAVEEYVRPRTVAESFVESADPSEGVRRDALTRVVRLNRVDVLDRLREVEEDLDLLRREAAAAEDEAQAARDDLEAELGRLEANLATQEEIRARLEGRISELQGQLREMDAEDARIGQIIRDGQREIARREAQRRAALTTTTTSTTTTTAAPTTTTPESDGDTVDGDGSPTSGSSTTTTTTSEQPAPPAIDPAEANLIWPTTGPVTSPFGPRRHPVLGGTRLHAGIDISNSLGAPIWAAQAGEVIYSGTMRGYGNVVMVDHGGFVTLYAHMSARSVTKGQVVSQGQEVGKVGSTGYSTGNHLHFEVRVNGDPQDPMKYLP